MRFRLLQLLTGPIRPETIPNTEYIRLQRRLNPLFELQAAHQEMLLRNGRGVMEIKEKKNGRRNR